MKDRNHLQGKRRILAGILVLLCAGMLFAVQAQAAGKTARSGAVGLSRTKLTLKEGRSRQLKLNNAPGKVVWGSSKRTVASVDSSGVVKAKEAGTCTITAQSGGRRYSCTVTVRVSKKQRICNKLQQTYQAEQNQDKIVVAGSSTIARWKSVSVVFDPAKTLNMGIGGSTVKQWLQWYDKLIVPYHPSAVVLFPGTGNQLNRGYSVSETTSDVCRLLKKLRAELPGVPLFYVSNYRTIKDAKLWPLEKSCNEKIKKYCGKLSDTYYIDVTKALASGAKPKAGIISPDGGHMNDKGYEIWDSLVVSQVKNVVEQAK